MESSWCLIDVDHLSVSDDEVLESFLNIRMDLFKLVRSSSSNDQSCLALSPQVRLFLENALQGWWSASDVPLVYPLSSECTLFSKTHSVLL